MKEIIYTVITISLSIILIGGILSDVKEHKSYSTIIKEQRDSISLLTGKIAQMSDSLAYYRTALADKDNLIFENYTLKYKINRIKQYDSIVIRNSSQSKYFRGWVRRVIYE